jgi:hypothetical protein
MHASLDERWTESVGDRFWLDVQLRLKTCLRVRARERPVERRVAEVTHSAARRDDERSCLPAGRETTRRSAAPSDRLLRLRLRLRDGIC